MLTDLSMSFVNFTELMMKLLSADGPDENCRKDYDKYAAKIK